MSQNKKAMEWTKIASDMANKSKFDDALRAINLALKYEQGNGFLLLKKASILERTEKYSEAILIYKQYQENIPESIDGLAAISRILKKLSRYEEAKSYDEELEVRAKEIEDDNPYTNFFGKEI